MARQAKYLSQLANLLATEKRELQQELQWPCLYRRAKGMGQARQARLFWKFD